MSGAVSLSKYSIGIGDRFAHQAKAQLLACRKAAERGVEVIPVWNKSNREHLLIGSTPASTRAAADEAVRALGWSPPYFVDADHIILETVDAFMEACDFFTLDVADKIGQPSPATAVQAFVTRHAELVGELLIPHTDHTFRIDREFVAQVANKYLAAVRQAGLIYQHIEEKKGTGRFVVEVSMDETDSPQTPEELLVILAAVADEGIPIQTIAPKFSGRFNKGVDYVGNLTQFREEFSHHLAVIAWAVQNYGLSGNLKLSLHSGSDKFSLYGAMHQTLRQFDAGVHLKTAGTTWLEELIGLAQAGGEGLELAKQLYAQAYSRRLELCAPYAAVIDIQPDRLPRPNSVRQWSSQQFVSALRHDPTSPAYNPDLRQLLHVGFKVAAQMGDRYLDLLTVMETTVSKNVTGNLYDRHIKPLFLGGQ